MAMAAGSAVAFFGGWALLAHSANPYGAANAPQGADVSAGQTENALPPLAPMPTPRAQSGTGPSIQPNRGIQLDPFSSGVQGRRQPRLRTGGS